MKLNDDTVEQVAGLLAQLKETYGWDSLCSMPAEDLVLLMERSARDPDAALAARVIAPWLQNGLLNQLQLPTKRRDEQIERSAVATGTDKQSLFNALLIFDKKLQLSRNEKKLQVPESDGTEKKEVPSVLQAKASTVLAAALGIGLAIGLLITHQVSSYRQVLQRQLEASEKEARKAKEEAKKQEDGEMNQRRSLPPPAATPLPEPSEIPRPSLPDSTAMPESVPSEQTRGSPSASDSNPSAEDIRWQGCDSPDPTAGTARAQNTWWPVVGPPESLEAVQRHCRRDAFRNNDGNTQIASFPDRSVAEAFAREISGDGRHPYFFYIGDPTTYD
jgi:hypothetical protein